MEPAGSAIEQVSFSGAEALSGARGDWPKPGAGVDHLSLRGLQGHSLRATADASAAASGGAGFSAQLPSLGSSLADFVAVSSSLVVAEREAAHPCEQDELAAAAGLAGPLGCLAAVATPSLDTAAAALADFAKGAHRPLPAAGGWPLEVAAAAPVGRGTDALTLPRVADGLSSDEGSEGSDNEGVGAFQGSGVAGRRRSSPPEARDSDDDAACFFAAHKRHMHTKSASEREAVKMIIDDIRRSLSKPLSDVVGASLSLQGQHTSEDTGADVWVIRDSYSEKLRRQDELRRARIEMERQHEEEFRRKQAEEVYHLEHEDTKLMTHQQHCGSTGDQQADGAAPNIVRPEKPSGAAGALPQPEANAEGVVEYSEHDRDIAGNWFVKKGKYRPVLASNSDSDSDGCEDISSAATSAVAAASVSSVHRQAAALPHVCHAARLADYRGRMGSRCADGEPRAVAGSGGAAAEPRRTPATCRAVDTDSCHGPPAALCGDGGSNSHRITGDRSQPMQDQRLPPQQQQQQRARHGMRSPSEVAVRSESCGSSAASDGSGCGDDDYDDVDDADDDHDGSGMGNDRREQRRHVQHHRAAASANRRGCSADYDTDDETDRLVQNEYRSAEGCVHIPEREAEEVRQLAKRNKAKEVAVYDPDDPTVLIEGILFRASYLGSTQLVSEVQPSKAMRMMQAQEAVGRIKAPDGESQPSTEVDLFVSTEKVMVLNTNLKEIIMDHSLRSISYIADIENVLVVMAKRSVLTSPGDDSRSKKQQKLLCHVFDTEEAQLIAKSIGQAFQVAYMEFLKANGIDDPGLLKETTYEDILNQQEIAHDELDMFTRRDMQKEVAISKARGEALGIVVVESGWGSMLPTVVLANMSALGPATRCGQLNIGDQIMAVNGISLVGLPLSTCQDHIKGVKSQTAVKLSVVSRPPVVDVLIKRPDVKYQLGFSVQNGVICSLLRGGIAERGGIRVGHRIIEINGQSVVATSHEKIVYTLSTSIGEIRMKTMPMSIFRLLTGQEVPHYI